MTTSGATSTLDTAARDWKSWLAVRGLDNAGAMTAYSVRDLLGGAGSALAGTRVYCAIDADGVPHHVRQTSGPLIRRITEHVKSGNGRDWAGLLV